MVSVLEREAPPSRKFQDSPAIGGCARGALPTPVSTLFIKMLYRFSEFILVAPVVFEFAIGLACGSVEALFDIVIPDSETADYTDHPKAFTFVAPWRLTPFLGVNAEASQKRR